MSANTRKPIKERIAQHHYHDIPPRTHAARGPDTEEPPLTRSSHGTPRTTASNVPPSQRRQPPAPRPVEEDDDEEVYETRPPSSVRRYAPTTGNHQQAIRSRRRPPVLAVVVILLSLTVGSLGALIVPPLWQRGIDQWTYHFPRTYQVDANVGHGTAKAPNSHFIAINNHGLIEVLEIPTGIPTKDNLNLYLIAQIDGPSPDQAPVTIEFEDVNGDGKPDMIVHCNGNEYILSNDGHTFKKS